MSELVEKLLNQIRGEKLPDPDQEIKFHESRKWRIDIAWPEFMLAVEVEGGTWTGGRHSRGKGFRQDCSKYNEMTLSGWTLLRFTSGMVSDGEAIQSIVKAIELKRELV